MMKSLLALALCFTIWSCQKPQAPQFVGVKSLEVTEVVGTKIQIEGQLVYFNPNAISGTLKRLDVDVFANDVPISKIKKDYNQVIDSNADFEIPMTASFELSDLISQDNILGGILNAVTQKSVQIKYSGTVKIMISNIPFTIPIEYEEQVELKR